MADGERPRPQVIKGDRITDGECNACHEDRSNVVYRIVMGNSELRVCINCKMHLEHALRTVNRVPKRAKV